MDMSQEDSKHSNYVLKANSNIEGIMFIALLLKYKIFIIITVLVAGTASVIISLILPNWYSSTVNAVPPQKPVGSLFESALGGVSSTLKEFGLTKLTGKGEGYSYIVILTSRTVKDSLIKQFNLPKVYDIPDTARTELYEMLESNLEITYEREGNYTITITDKSPARAAEMANYLFETSNMLAVSVFQTEATVSRKYLENRINSIDSTINAISEQLQRYSKKKFVFSPMDQAKAISQSYTELRAELMQQEILYDLFKNKFGENDPNTQIQAKLLVKIKSQLNDMVNKPGFAGNFPLTDAAEVGIEFLKLYAEYEAFTKVKAYVLPLLENSKLDERSGNPSLLIIDKAIPPDKKSSPKRSLIVLGSVFGSFVLAVLFVLLLDGYKRLKTNYKKLLAESV